MNHPISLDLLFENFKKCDSPEFIAQVTFVYSEYGRLVKELDKLIESKTQTTKNHIFYDLITVQEINKIIDGNKN